MRHNKTVQPTDPGLTPPSSLPDRSDLSELYINKPRNTKVNNSVSATGSTPKMSASEVPVKIDQTLVSILLTIPLVATYWAADFIYRGADANIEKPDPFFPLLGLFASAVCVLSWVVSLWALKKRFDTYTLGLGVFIVVYSFYLLPALEIVYGGGMHERLGMLLTIALWLIFNYLAVLYIIWAFNRGVKSSVNRFTVLALPVMILVVLAILF